MIQDEEGECLIKVVLCKVLPFHGESPNTNADTLAYIVIRSS